MKRILICVCFIVFAGQIVKAQAGWIDYKIDSKLSIKVPAQPTASDEYSVISTATDSVVCIITKIDMQKVAGLDSAALAGMAPTKDFTDGVTNGMLQKMPGFTLGDLRSVRWNNHYAYYIDAVSEEKKIKSYSLMIIIGSNLYSISTVVPDGKSLQDRDYFFASLKLN